MNKHSTAYQRTYANQVKICNGMQRIIHYFEEELEKLDIDIPSPPETEAFVREVLDRNRNNKVPPATRLNTFAEELKKNERDLRDITENYQKLVKVYNSKVELKYVLTEALKYSDSNDDELMADASAANQANDAVKFNYMTGVVDDSEHLSFQKMIFRATRGNCFVRFTPILGENKPDGSPGDPVLFADPVTDEKKEKQVFIAMFPGREIESQLRKICSAYGANIYEIPDIENTRELHEEIRVASDEIADAHHIQLYNRKQAETTAELLARNLQQWKIQVNMELGTYDTLNKLEIRDTGHAVGKGWVVAAAADDVASLVRKAGGSEGSGGGSINESPKPWPTPPTYFKTNKYTSPFQGIVNTYGVPDYQEANPAIITLITFPFSFAIMFGDVGHGLCWLIGSIYMIAAEKSLGAAKLNETVAMIYNARYMLFLMSLFAVYNGFIYNDTFALGVTYFGPSQWVNDSGTLVQDGVYPFGLDPVWKISSNEILFGNSLKMKIAVIFGVLHMVLGVFFKGANKIYFRDWNAFFNEFIPQIIFILSFFGYMVFMIFLKWCTDWVAVGSEFPGAGAPSLITTLVNIALQPGSIDNGTKLYGFDSDLQANVQVGILIVAFVCIPWMLVPKPLIENCQNQRKAHEITDHAHDDDDEEEGHQAHSCADLFIHQVIETIEYVLGCVSNTASYLRLWALSLAHMELSKTFWDLIMVNILNMDMGVGAKAVLLFFAYSVFAAITAGVLLAMDFLECFLHALRLHWVEFQNKFFGATGHAFESFSYQRIIKDAFSDESE